MTTPLKEYTHEYFLTAAQCNAQKELSPQMLVQNIIEVATEHANILGIGFTRLSAERNIWVLSRLTYELKRYPAMHNHYSLTTWVEDFNRHFSNRCFEIRVNGNETIGYVRTLWAAINIDTRKAADLTSLSDITNFINDKPCPIARQSRIKPDGNPTATTDYTFQVCDIDCNRHVNSGRYVELIVNQNDLDVYDNRMISRFEIAFHHEARFGDKVDVRSEKSDDTMIIEIAKGTEPICMSRLFLSNR